MYKDKTKEQKHDKKGYVEFEEIFDGDELRVKGNEMLNKNQ